MGDLGIPVQRKVGLHHFAVFRGWLQGLEIETLADRYLETGLDLRLAKKTLNWIKDTVRQAALRNGRYGEARLLRVRLGQGETDSKIPDFEDYRAEVDPTGFYMESELLERYLSDHPQASNANASRRQRLRQRQLDAVIWLEKLVATQPVPSDLVSAWFDKSVSDRLVLAGIGTLAELMQRIEERGFRWYTTVPRLGVKGAERLVRWLQSNEATIGPLTQNSLVPRNAIPMTQRIASREKSTGIVPIESLKIPTELDGAAAENRAPTAPLISAQNDREAIEAWIRVSTSNEHTSRAYRREAERLLLWALLERRKPLSGLGPEDCASYRDWLVGLGRTEPDKWPFNIPQEDWCAEKNTPRFSPAWRPFVGALSASSIKQALTTLAAMFRWLTDARYCNYNPFLFFNSKVSLNDGNMDVELTHVLSREQWDIVIDAIYRKSNDEAIEALLADPAKQKRERMKLQRLRFLFPFAHATGMRGSEIAACKLGDIYTRPASDGIRTRWMITVFGKGGKKRAVPLTEPTLEVVRLYLTMRGLNPDPRLNPRDTPMLARLDGEKSVSYMTVYRLTKQFFEQVAQEQEELGKDHNAYSLKKASTHWIRHTRANSMSLDGLAISMIQKFLGHANIATTSIYTASQEAELWEELTRMEAV